MQLKVDFTEFATEQDYDLEIYNGPTTSPLVRSVAILYLLVLLLL
jgi:hypothetical protein